MHPQAPGQAPATNFDPPRILNFTTSATLLPVLWDGVYHYTLPKTCLALCEHSPLFASLCHSCSRPRCVLPLTLYMVQEHANDKRQCHNVSEQDNSCSGQVLICQSNHQLHHRLCSSLCKADMTHGLTSDSRRAGCQWWSQAPRVTCALLQVCSILTQQHAVCPNQAQQEHPDLRCRQECRGKPIGCQQSYKLYCTNTQIHFVCFLQAVGFVFRMRSTANGSMVKWTGKEIPNRRRQKGFKPMGS